MKTREEVEAFLTDLNAVCDKHGVSIIARDEDDFLARILFLDRADCTDPTREENGEDLCEMKAPDDKYNRKLEWSTLAIGPVFK